MRAHILLSRFREGARPDRCIVAGSSDGDISLEEFVARWDTFKQRTQTLEDFLGAWFGPLKDTLDELGAEAVEDLKELEAEHIERLAAKLKFVQAKKFAKKIATIE